MRGKCVKAGKNAGKLLYNKGLHIVVQAGAGSNGTAICINLQQAVADRANFKIKSQGG